MERTAMYFHLVPKDLLNGLPCPFFKISNKHLHTCLTDQSQELFKNLLIMNNNNMSFLLTINE